MDNLFKTRNLTGAVNKMRTAETRIYDRFFRPKERFSPTDRLAFDIITGSEGILKNLSVYSAANVNTKTGRSTITLQAPRLSEKIHISAAELNALRGYGKTGQEMLKDLIAREQMNLVQQFDRTKEYWAAGAMKGIVYDADGTTELVNYGLDATHDVTLTNTDLWTDAASSPLNQMRAWKKLIADDSGAAITSWFAYFGSSAMDALIENAKSKDFLKYTQGVQISQTGQITRLADVEIEEYHGSYLNSAATRTRFIDDKHIMLVGVCSDLTDCQYAPVVRLESAQGVGNVDATGKPAPFFSDSWEEKDPSGRWLLVETRPLPILQRPDCVLIAQVVA